MDFSDPGQAHSMMLKKSQRCWTYDCIKRKEQVPDRSQIPIVTYYKSYYEKDEEKIRCVKDIWYPLKNAEHGLCYSCNQRRLKPIHLEIIQKNHDMAMIEERKRRKE